MRTTGFILACPATSSNDRRGRDRPVQLRPGAGCVTAHSNRQCVVAVKRSLPQRVQDGGLQWEGVIVLPRDRSCNMLSQHIIAVGAALCQQGTPTRCAPGIEPCRVKTMQVHSPMSTSSTLFLARPRVSTRPSWAGMMMLECRAGSQRVGVATGRRPGA